MNKAVCLSLIFALVIAIIVVIAYTREQNDSEYFDPQPDFQARCVEDCLMSGTGGWPEVCQSACSQGLQYLAVVDYSDQELRRKMEISGAINGDSSYLQNH